MIPDNDPMMDTVMGSYKIIEAIGEGGMARIYKGYHADLKRYAAVKVVNWGLQEDPEFTKRFRREAQAVAALRHPNIVQIFDFGKYTAGYFMAMEFIDGVDLSKQLHQLRQAQELLPKDKITKVIKDVAAALDYAHSRDVIHRDIKPSNIMITTEGQSILTDFGLVMLPANKSQATLGSTFGTPHYVPPEQAISSAAAVTASDIYSLGVILYEMVTGQLPFDDESPLSVALKHVSEVPTPPSVINPDLSRDVEEVILKSLSKQPVDRFATAGEMAFALKMAWSGLSPAKEKAQKSFVPVLPTGVPPAAEVSDITLPDAMAVTPIPGAAEGLEPGESTSEKSLLFGWWAWALLGGLIVLVVLFLFFNRASFTPSTPTPTAIAAENKSETAQAFAPPISTPEPPTDTPTPKPSATPLPTDTPTPEPSFTPTPTSTFTPTSTSTPSPSPTSTATPEPSPTDTPTPLPRPTATLTNLITRKQLKNKILFRTDRSGAVEIYRMDANGSNQFPLPREGWSLYTELQAELPFSADGDRRVVVRGEGQLDLWRADLTTNDELRITSTGKPEYDPAWSPVDDRIAYVSEETGNGDIYMLNLGGSAIVRLTDNLDDFDKHPTWSPDGEKIAFWSDMGFNNTRQIWVIDLDTNVLTSLSDNPFNDWDPVWVH